MQRNWKEPGMAVPASQMTHPGHAYAQPGTAWLHDAVGHLQPWAGPSQSGLDTHNAAHHGVGGGVGNAVSAHVAGSGLGGGLHWLHEPPRAQEVHNHSDDLSLRAVRELPPAFHQLYQEFR